MRRIILWLASTVTVVVLLFGNRTSTNDTSAAPVTSIQSGYSATSSAASSTSAPTSSGTSTSTSTGGSGGTTTTSSGTTTTTVTGSVAQTQWGPVQVQLTVTGGQITAVDVLQYPQGNNKDQQINARALPILVQDTLRAQSPKIDMVSGATVTSTGYLQSLQSALDQAGL
jgi:uncharacterized protein with FMN-binding domain